MNFLKQLFSGSSAQPVSPFYDITVKCRRCGEMIHAQINLNNELSVEYSESGEQTYICRKTLMGKEHCFQRVEVSLVFDVNRKILSEEVIGGEIAEKV